MEFLKQMQLFDFLYGGVPLSQLEVSKIQTECDNTQTTVYELADGLRVTNILKKHGEAYEWVNWFENTADEPTQIISELYDACVTLPLPWEKTFTWTSYLPAFEDITAVYAPSGSTWTCDAFSAQPDKSGNNRLYNGQLYAGETKKYACEAGRSSCEQAPFFNIHKSGKGYIFGIGWSGQWNCFLTRTEDDVIIKTKIEDTNFRLLPKEKIRTSSFVILPYETTVPHSWNLWRRLMRESFSLIGQEGRDAYGPLCAGVWGGMQTQAVLERVNTIEQNGLPFEYVWMDAGWYGIDTQPSRDEHEGDWARHTGDWRVSPLVHPGALKDVAEAVHKAGMKFLLWVEPERIRRGTPIVTEHPEYFIFPASENDPTLMLNLGNEAAWNYCFNTLAGLIQEIGVDCYRQDYNIWTSLRYWRSLDTADRAGITEIKHIMGLYRLWDALLQKFPNLLIDNCASGGRRIDVETLRRSVPLWRSDYQCVANYPAEGAQGHNLTYNLLMPYSGTGTGRLYDTYCFRSAYSPALLSNHPFSQREGFGDDPEKLQWLKKQLQEYLQVRPYMSEDFYPLTEVSDRKDTWCVSQFDRPSGHDGMLMLFRREKSPYENATFFLYGIEDESDYVFTDADTGEEIVLSGTSLLQDGFHVSLREKRSSKIYFYKKK